MGSAPGCCPGTTVRDAAHVTHNVVTQELSIQERLYPQLDVLRVRACERQGAQAAQLSGEGSVTAAFEPWPEHDNGFGFLNGGIIATVLDCHSGAAVFHRAHLLGMDPPQGAPLLFVTAGLDLRYLRPVPLGQVLEASRRGGLGGRRRDDRRGGAGAGTASPCAAASVLWRRWRPR